MESETAGRYAYPYTHLLIFTSLGALRVSNFPLDAQNCIFLGLIHTGIPIPTVTQRAVIAHMGCAGVAFIHMQAVLLMSIGMQEMLDSFAPTSVRPYHI